MIVEVIIGVILIIMAILLFFGASKSPQQSTRCTYCKYFNVKTQRCTNKESQFFDCVKTNEDASCEKWRYFYDGTTDL